MNVCVFCGSSPGNHSAFAEAAKDLGSLIGKYNHTLIYGGGKIGLMGILADAVLFSQGKVIGVIPNFLFDKEVGHSGVSELIQVQTMHERKQKMAEIADAFIALPGGWGTLDELAEILTWRQLQIVNKPIAILNTNKFFNPLIDMMESMVTSGFLKRTNLDKLLVADNPKQLLTKLGWI